MPGPGRPGKEGNEVVIPANAGIQRLGSLQATVQRHWVPAFAGATQKAFDRCIRYGCNVSTIDT